MAKNVRYQEKKRLGLVPTYYDTESKRFLAGAHKNFTTNDPFQRWKIAQNDWYFVRRVREEMGVRYA